MLWIPHQLIGVPQGFTVTLECTTEAHPASLNYWTREDGHMIHDSRKYRSANEVGSPQYKVHMKLTIADIQPKDFGTYKCVAKNPRGETEGQIKLYGESSRVGSEMNGDFFGGLLRDESFLFWTRCPISFREKILKKVTFFSWRKEKPENYRISKLSRHSILKKSVPCWLLFYDQSSSGN